MAHRLNIVLNDEAWKSLQQLPKGMRSRYISEAVAERLQRDRRREAAREMDEVRESLLPLDDAVDIAEILHKDRVRDDA